MSGLFLYTTEDGRSRIQFRADGQTVWLTQLEMAEFFQTSKQNIAKHLKAIFADGELYADSVVNQWLTTAADSKIYITHVHPFVLSQEASVKKSLIVGTGRRRQATTEESSVVQAEDAPRVRLGR